MFQLIGAILAVVTLLWVVVTKPAHASLTDGAFTSTGLYSAPLTAGAGLATGGVEFAAPSR